MEVKVIRSYTDKELNRNMQIGDVIDVTKERATLLIEKDYVVANFKTSFDADFVTPEEIELSIDPVTLKEKIKIEKKPRVKK